MQDVTDKNGTGGSDCRALTVTCAAPFSRRAVRTAAPFLTQLLAARARLRSSWRHRRGDPQYAAALYEARALARPGATTLLNRVS
jgi:hypothetical protein